MQKLKKKGSKTNLPGRHGMLPPLAGGKKDRSESVAAGTAGGTTD